ncbi:hypothetical protein Pcinc_008268 [Petrolisthes cinctipes]|uniref:Uncharacterized protein n=1 Tax=Petrolisthes cinctipes TaxID=88211 RepID=A0AAE1G7G2_PETCI|nr:hypothetical protein Pcinc_008268 [Petrolisthes cinctipes]
MAVESRIWKDGMAGIDYTIRLFNPCLLSIQTAAVAQCGQSHMGDNSVVSDGYTIRLLDPCLLPKEAAGKSRLMVQRLDVISAWSEVGL